MSRFARLFELTGSKFDEGGRDLLISIANYLRSIPNQHRKHAIIFYFSREKKEFQILYSSLPFGTGEMNSLTGSFACNRLLVTLQIISSCSIKETFMLSRAHAPPSGSWCWLQRIRYDGARRRRASRVQLYRQRSEFRIWRQPILRLLRHCSILSNSYNSSGGLISRSTG